MIDNPETPGMEKNRYFDRVFFRTLPEFADRFCLFVYTGSQPAWLLPGQNIVPAVSFPGNTNRMPFLLLWVWPIVFESRVAPPQKLSEIS